MNDIKKFDLDTKNKFNVEYIAAMDEAGRGSFVSCLTAACCIMPDNYFNPLIKDSKQLTQSKRFELQEEIIKNAYFYNIISLDNDYIDQYGIQYANIEIFRLLKNSIKEKSIVYLIDGNIMDSEPWCHTLIKGDSLSFSIACASILAKCTRDQHIINLSKDYPQYNLEHNKGYGQDYIALVKQFGPPQGIHRNSYKIKDKEQIKLF